MTVFGLNTLFNHLPRLPTLFDQAVNVFSADDFAPDSYSRLLVYHRYFLCLSPHQAVNVFSIYKPTDRHFYSTSSSTSSQTSISADTPQSHNLCLCYSYNSCHRLDMADSLKTIN